METVSVDEALTNGRRRVYYPAFAIGIVTHIVCGCLVATKVLLAWTLAVGLFAGFVGAMFYWSFTVTKWRLWAFDSVRNVHQLKRQAIQERLMWPDGHFLSKIGILSKADKEKWAELQNKFNRPDVFIDDFSVEHETRVYFSKPQAFAVMALMLLFVAAGIFLLVAKTQNNLLSYTLIVLGAIVAFVKLLQATSKVPQIILSEKGIQTGSIPFYEWKDISNEEAISEGSGKSRKFYIVYNHPKGKVKLLIGPYNINRKTLEKLLILYRGRYKKNHDSKITSSMQQSTENRKI